MNTISFEKNNALMIAHRGLSGLETENTNSAFVAAGNRSYFGIETDIHRTGDGNFVIIHDDTTERVSGVKIAVEIAPFSELRELVLLDTNGKRDRADLHIPSLDEYIGICKRYEKIAVLELKCDFTFHEIENIVTVIKNEDYLNSVIFISFNLDVLKRLRGAYPNQPTQFLTGKYSDGLLDILFENKLDLDIYYKELNEDIIKRYHERGIKINCWTVDSLDDAQRLATWGVDFITSNILE